MGMELTSRELHIVSCLAKYVKFQIQDCGEENWRVKITAELDEIIELSDRGLTNQLMEKLYRSIR